MKAAGKGLMLSGDESSLNDLHVQRMAAEMLTSILEWLMGLVDPSPSFLPYGCCNSVLAPSMTSGYPYTHVRLTPPLRAV